MNKLVGLKILESYGFQIPELYSYKQVMDDDFVINKGLSIRLSSKANSVIDVGLPSIHNCLDKSGIKDFYLKYSDEYNIIIHETFFPDIIGTVSKFTLNGLDCVVVETYKDFLERKRGMPNHREVSLYIEGRRIKSDENCIYNRVVNMLKIIDLEDYNVEFVIQNHELFFTDFYTNSFKENNYSRILHNQHKL